MKKIDWANVDWTKDNYTLTQELNRAYDTVAKFKNKSKKTLQYVEKRQ